jgi:uncharacterized membrane protein
VKKASEFVASRLLAGVLVITPVYLAVLLLLKVAKSLSHVVRPFIRLLPSWLPAEKILSVLLVLVVCFLIGLVLGTPVGKRVWERIENAFFRRIPGYEVVRSFTRRMAGQTQDEAWKPALAEIEEALVPAFIIEELRDGRFTVFVPAVPSPLTGTIYILTADRVHPLNISVAHAITAVSRWGSGCKDLVAAMEGPYTPSSGPAYGRDSRVR